MEKLEDGLPTCEALLKEKKWDEKIRLSIKT